MFIETRTLYEWRMANQGYMDDDHMLFVRIRQQESTDYGGVDECGQEPAKRTCVTWIESSATNRREYAPDERAVVLAEEFVKAFGRDAAQPILSPTLDDLKESFDRLFNQQGCKGVHDDKDEASK